MINVTRLAAAYEFPKLGAATKPPAAASSNFAARAAFDDVTLSRQGKLLGSLPELLLPTRDNVRKLANSVAAELKDALATSGIAAEPPVRFDMDPASGKVSVDPANPAAEKINAMLKENPGLELKIHNVMAISSHVIATEPSLKFDAEYRQAQGTAETNKVLAKYSELLSGQPPQAQLSMAFNGSALQINANGAAWLNTDA